MIFLQFLIFPDSSSLFRFKIFYPLWIFSRFAIFNYLTAEPVRIVVFLNEFLRAQLTVDLCYSLISRLNRSINIRKMLLEIFIIQQVIFGKIVESAGRLFQIIELCPSFKSFSITGCNIHGDIDIQASFSGQMLWSFHFATGFSQTDTDIFFAIITSKRFHISEVFLLLCTEG